MYYTLFHCHLLYAAEIWGCTTQNNIKKLFVKQKKAIRIIHNLHYNAHTEPYFKSSEILKHDKLIEISKLKIILQSLNNLKPSLLCIMWSTNRIPRQNNDDYQQELRNNDGDIYIPPFWTNLTSRLP